MQEILSSKPPVVTETCVLNKSRAQHHRNLKLISYEKTLSILICNKYFH